MRVAALLCALWFPAQALAQHGFWQPDDRILITAFQDAVGIATDQRHVFVATANGLEVYDQTFQRWLPPSTVEDGYPASERPARLAYDSRQRMLWLLTEAQTLYTWSPVMQNWEPQFGTDVPDEVRRRLHQPFDQRDPAWTIMRNFVGRDKQGLNWRPTALEAAERPGTYWASLYGGNFAFVDTRNLSSQRYTFGTVSRGVSALTLNHNGQLYFGGDGRDTRAGVARADTMLQSWEHFEAVVSAGPRRRVNALLAVGSNVLAAADDGLFLLRGDRWQVVADAPGRALAQAAGRTWAATRGMLGWIDSAGGFTRSTLPLQDVNALTVRNDTLWVGAAAGLYRIVDDTPALVLTVPSVRDLAWVGEMLVMITAGELHSWNGGALTTPVRHGSLQQIGGPVSVSVIGERVFIGGARGLAEWHPASHAWRHLTVPNDIPEGPVNDVLGENGRLWLATPAGALRLYWK